MEVRKAANVAEAKKNLEAAKPDIILLDWMLPGLCRSGGCMNFGVITATKACRSSCSLRADKRTTGFEV